MEIKLNKAFKKAKDSKERYRILYGGAGSGKSYYMAQETILNMISNKEYSYMIIRKTAKSIKNSVFLLLTDIIKSNDLGAFFTINKTEMSIQCANGARIITSGLDDVEKLKSVAGINRIWIEEASEISEQDFNQLDLRLRGKNNVGYQLTLTFNPISELHWIKRLFFDVGVADSFILKTTYLDNSHLDDKYIEALERLKDQDYQYYRIYCLGDWGSLGNLIFTNWEKADLADNNFDNFFNGGDWGFADDPFAAVRVHHDKMRKTIYITDEIYQTGLHNDESAELVKAMIGSEMITMDSAEPKSIADYKRLGVKSKGAKKGQGSVEHGIKWLQGCKIVVDERCINTIKELTSYKWREDKNGNVIAKPVDMNNHIIDALRYALEPEMENKGKWGWQIK